MCEGGARGERETGREGGGARSVRGEREERREREEEREAGREGEGTVGPPLTWPVMWPVRGRCHAGTCRSQPERVPSATQGTPWHGPVAGKRRK